MTNNIYQGLNDSPINSVAKRVLSGGVNFEFENTEPNRHESLTPLPVTWGSLPYNKQFINLTGVKKGRLTVIGWNSDKGRWVCRCSCGVYLYRTSRAIKNNKNSADACYQCTKLIEAKKSYHHQKTGRYLKREDLI